MANKNIETPRVIPHLSECPYCKAVNTWFETKGYTKRMTCYGCKRNIPIEQLTEYYPPKK